MEEKIRILCVDDEINVLRSIERLFLDEDYEILNATSGAEGLEIMRKVSPVQIVISDYRMPGMNGVDFLKEVYSHWPDTVRIMLSGYADAAAIVSAVNEGQIYRFIPKPWDDNELRMTVSNALDRYFLHDKNIRLTEELKRSNEGLKELNEGFERLVEERVSELTLKNNMLTYAQNILDSLPVAVIGTDQDGLILLCNKKGFELFQGDKGIVLGMDRRAALPAHINNVIDKVIEKNRLSEYISINSGKAVVKGIAMTYSDGRDGIVLVFDRVEKVV